MQDQTRNTAVLLFNYSEKQRASLRTIAPRIGKKTLESLITQLNKRVKTISQRTALPFFQIDAQGNKDFGKQLFDAYQELFDQGFEAVIGLSNDCPHLNEEDLLLAKEALQKEQFVFGPATDGGLYLLGIKRGAIEMDDFLQLDWQGDQLFSSFLQQSSLSEQAYALLEEKADMDTVGAFQKAFDLHLQYLLKIKGILLSFSKQKFKYYYFVESQFSFLSPSLRAPPFSV